MTDLIGPVNWASYKNTIGVDAFDTFFQDDLTWKRVGLFIDEHGEDEIGKPFTDVVIKTLIQYNVFRTWPVNRPTESGELEDQTMVAWLSKDYLNTAGYLNANGNFDYNVDEDRFVFNGVEYKAFGDTDAAQAQDGPLLVMLILQREEIPTTGDNN